MTDALWGNTSPCQESLQHIMMGCSFSLAFSVHITSVDTKQATAWRKWYSQAVRYTGQLDSRFLSTHVGQKLYLSPALWHNLSFVWNVGLYKQRLQSPFSVRTETLLLAHTCGFNTGVKLFFPNNNECVNEWMNEWENCVSDYKGGVYHQGKQGQTEGSIGVFDSCFRWQKNGILLNVTFFRYLSEIQK